MHHSASLAVLSAVAFAAALGLGGCSEDPQIPPTTPVTLTPVAPPPVPADFPLPAPEALIDVMTRLTDPKVPTPDKMNLIQFSTPEDGTAIDKFLKAVADGGYRPLTFQPNDLGWSAKQGGNVLTNMVVHTANPKAGENGDFKFPMEFAPADGTWQLTRDSADQLLQYGSPATSSATPPPLPTEPPAPAPPAPPTP